MVIYPREPFNFIRTLRFILSPPTPVNGKLFSPILDHFENGEYRRVAEVGRQPVLLGVKEVGERNRAGLKVSVLAGSRDRATLAMVKPIVERQFSTNLDLTPFYLRAESDPVLSMLGHIFRGMRIPQAQSVYETLVAAILEQQVNLAFAHKVKRALVETFGDAIDFEGRRYYAFPQPSSLAKTTPSELRRLQISGPKANYIIGISRSYLDGSLDLDGLRTVDPQIAYARLLEQKGVGHWTAQYVGLRALGHLDCLPAGDVGLQKAIQFFYSFRRQPAANRVEKHARKWLGWRSYATFYLWLTYWESREWKERMRAQLRDGTPRGKR